MDILILYLYVKTKCCNGLLQWRKSLWNKVENQSNKNGQYILEVSGVIGSNKLYALTAYKLWGDISGLVQETIQAFQVCGDGGIR